MKRPLLPSSAFVRAAKRLVKRDPSLALPIQAVMELLVEDAFHPQLRTHKLKGQLEGSGPVARAMTCGSSLALSSTKGTKPSFWKDWELTTRSTDFPTGPAAIIPNP